MRELDTYLNEGLLARGSSHINAEDTGAMVEDTIGKWLQGTNFKTAGCEADVDNNQFTVLIDLAKRWPHLTIRDMSPLRGLPSQWHVVLKYSDAMEVGNEGVISELFIGTSLDEGDAERLTGMLSGLRVSHMAFARRSSIKGTLSLQMTPDEMGEIRVDMSENFIKGIQGKVLDLHVKEDSADDLGNITIAATDITLAQMMVPIKKGYITVSGLPATPSESITIQGEDANMADQIGDLLQRNNDGIISLDKSIWEIPSKDTPWDVSALGQLLDQVLWGGPGYDLNRHISIVMVEDPRSGNYYNVEIHNRRRKRTKAMPYTISIHSQLRPEITYRISEM